MEWPVASAVACARLCLAYGHHIDADLQSWSEPNSTNESCVSFEFGGQYLLNLTRFVFKMMNFCIQNDELLYLK